MLKISDLCGFLNDELIIFLFVLDEHDQLIKYCSLYHDILKGKYLLEKLLLSNLIKLKSHL